MKHDLKSLFVAFSLGIVFQMIMKLPTKYWYSTEVAVGDVVEVNDEDYGVQLLYQDCEKGKVLAIDSKLAFVRWYCPNTEDIHPVLRGGGPTIIPYNFLKLKGLK